MNDLTYTGNLAAIINANQANLIVVTILLLK